MGKHDMLPFKMTVERGKLIPATPYDAERLDTWRNGTPVNVSFVRDGGRVMERKWWAILNRAVKECKTPWKTAAEASEAIKLAIGVVNLTKTVRGDFLAYPKSLTELDDPELDDAVQQMIDVVHHVTGVDPEEWKRQVAHIRDEPKSAAPSPADGSETGSVAGSPSAATDTASQDDMEEGDNTGQVSSGAAPSSTYSRADCIRAFMNTATNAELSVAERRQLLEDMKELWKEALASDLDFVRACLTTSDKVAKGELETAAARKYLEAHP